MRVGVVLLVVCLLGSVGRPTMACDSVGADATEVAAASVAIEAACPCASAMSHGDYLRCAKQAAGVVLTKQSCLRAIIRCAVRSTCGRPDAAVCCRTRSDGSTRGTIVGAPDRCIAPRGGSACLAPQPSLCGACTSGGCATTTSITTTSTTTTLYTSVCGNGVIEPGNATTGGEQCDGQAICGPDCLVHAGASCDLGGGYCFGGVPALGFDTYWNVGKPCYIIGGRSTPGRCIPGDPTACTPPPPGVELPPFFVCGTIVDEPLPPTSLCCQQGATCTAQVVASDSQAQLFPCNIVPFGTDVLVVGTCGADGRCLPAS
jgi:hypothetical protein